jgi:hypothetical protein
MKLGVIKFRKILHYYDKACFGEEYAPPVKAQQVKANPKLRMNSFEDLFR